MTDCKLFVSHTCRVPEDDEQFPDAAARKAEAKRREDRLTEVCVGLHEAGFRVLVDRRYEMEKRGAFGDHPAPHGAAFPDRILAGDDWSLRLDEWLAECHAAIILFNRAALTHSYWVSKEAAILGWRRALDPSFTLIPVLLDGVTPDDLQQGITGVLRITQGQCVTGADDPAAIVQAVTDKLGDPQALVEETPFDHLESALSLHLEDAKERNLEAAWSKLQDTRDVLWDPRSGTPFADAFARFLVRSGGIALENLERTLRLLDPPLRQENARQVLERVQGLWVDGAAASALIASRQRRCAAGLAARYFAEFTARCYLGRAWPAVPRPQSVQTTASDASRTLDDLRVEIWQALYPDMDAEEEADSIDDDIRDYPGTVVVIIPPGPPEAPVPDGEIVEDLLLYPNLILLVGTTHADPATLPACVATLEPALDARSERLRFREYNRILSLKP